MQWLHVNVLIGMLWALMLASSLATASENSFSDLVFFTENYPPSNFSEGDVAKGYSVDILVAAAAAVGQEIKPSQIQVVPWSFAYKETLTNPKAVLFSTTRTSHREQLFNWVGPITDAKLVLITRKGSKVKIDNPIDIAKYRVGVVRDDIGEQKLLALGIPRAAMREAPYVTRLLELLLKNRIDLLAFSENSIYWWSAKSGLDSSIFETVYILNNGYLYYAFNRSINKSVREELQKGLNRIKAKKNEDGVTIYQSIMKKYR
ncbi:transporter substrate-binding domain-containing protein [Vibrio sp. S4M6]|uniref:substrate-binding periplasmic protein n=1 Tax=Vibrio sinus TaxID=2946865 RepID=UPI00202A421C|nr:transporter substrate-binding domain-containing protein [Vibrio sinus]MCL9780051.1 transporter substrate-binding domain-containing protein [Vibrio sinus]